MVKTRLDQLTQTEQELKIDLNKPLKEQDPLNELSSSASALQVLRRLGSIFTSVYVAVHKLKKDSWKELQFSLVDNSKLNVLQTDAMWCFFDAFLTSVEPKNFKEALLESSWIDAMQEEIHKFKQLDVWELVPCPDLAMIIKLKWIFKVKQDKFG
ncbi:hypothetical protein Tco_0241132, partial [Tanacetum coccineum]